MSDTKKKTNTNVRMIVQIGMLAAIAVILMLFEVPLPFAPNFYKIDLSEVPVLVGAFTMGPVAGVMIELVKVLLNLLINGTQTAGVGELGNFIVGCAFIVPAAIIYKKMHSRKGAVIGMVVGTIFLAVSGCFVNAYLLLPAYAAAFHMPIEALVGMGTAINPAITNLFGFVVFAVAPFNIVKGCVVSIVVTLIYKKISPLLRIQK